MTVCQENLFGLETDQPLVLPPYRRQKRKIFSYERNPRVFFPRLFYYSDIDGFKPVFLPILGFEFYFLPILKRFKALHGYSGKMDKNITLPFLGGNKTVSYFSIKPFHSSLAQKNLLELTELARIPVNPVSDII